MLKKSVSMSKDKDQWKFKHIPQFGSSTNLKENSEFKKLSDKYASTKKMKAINRKFNKSLFSRLAKRIQERAISFYNYGLRESQKSSHKCVFVDVFNVKRNELKGSISTGELWDNKNSIAYLKENKMFFNKDVLLEELKNLNKQRKNQIRKQRIKKTVFYQNFKKLKNDMNQTCIQQKKSNAKDPKQSCRKIRSQIQSLVSKSSQNVLSRSRKILEKLENDQKKMDHIGQRFSDKMIVLM